MQTCLLYTSAAYDPAFSSVFETNNTAYFGHGVVFHKYTGARGKSGSNDAGAEYVARIRRVMDDSKVAYQVSEMGRVDAGGGNTIAWIPAAYDMDAVSYTHLDVYKRQIKMWSACRI